MKIRELLSKKKKIYIAVAVLSLLIFVVCIQFTLFTEANWPYYLALLPLVTMLFGLFSTKFRVRCPSCNGNIGFNHSQFTNISIPLFKPISHCPFCGVSLDTDVGT